MKQNKKSENEKRLRIIRRVFYVTTSFLLLQVVGMFSMAGLRGIYVITEKQSNAFSPKPYVDVDIIEPAGNEYTIGENGAVVASGDGITDKRKQVWFVNQGSNKKSVLLRASIVAELHEKTELGFVCIGELTEPTDFTIKNDQNAIVTDPQALPTVADQGTGGWYKEGNYYYYTAVLGAGEQTNPLFTDVTITNQALVTENRCVKFHVMVDTIEVTEDGDSNLPTETSLNTVKQYWETDTNLIPSKLWTKK